MARMPRESSKRRRERAERVLRGLRSLYPGAATELRFETPFQLLVATVLSAQATDVGVNKATPSLFARYPDAASLARADALDVEPFIRTIGLYHAKARNLTAAARLLVERHGGEVPRTLEELVALPGVGRKTANVVLANAFGQATIAVDTHVGRVARRLRFSRESDPNKVERDLQKLFVEDDWVFVHHGFILHGRRVCKARRPACERCELCPDCPSCSAPGPVS
jgi:endonuclease III